jgi:DNA-binding NarL/FixJ family response regulator
MRALADPAADPTSTNHRIAVVMIEDNDGDAALLDASLAEACTGSPLHPWVTVQRARSLAGGIALLRTARPDVVLLDLGLPDSTGLQSLIALRAACRLPIVVMTGLADEQVALGALQEGAEDYLFKGELTPSVTLRALRYAIERKEQEAELARARWLSGIGATTLAVLHELNNPLTSLMMNAELVANGVRDRDVAVAILESAKRIAAVTRRLSQEQRDPRVVEYVDGMKMLDLREP